MLNVDEAKTLERLVSGDEWTSYNNYSGTGVIADGDYVVAEMESAANAVFVSFARNHWKEIIIEILTLKTKLEYLEDWAKNTFPHEDFAKAYFAGYDQAQQEVLKILEVPLEEVDY